MVSTLEQLRKYSTVVADTCDFELISQYEPKDATTNPSLILKAVKKDQYKHILEDTVARAKEEGVADVDEIVDRILVRFGKEILNLIPGRVSTELDARLSFDTDGSYERAKRIIKLYEEAGISKARVLIKLASTWEGIEAAKKLEQEGIKCNMTLLFNTAQAAACAEAGAQLISPFVGRILDWYKKSGKFSSAKEHQDPGVLSIKSIYRYYLQFGYKTEIMGASFRSVEQILEIAGVNLITISPSLLDELKQSQQEVSNKVAISSGDDALDRIVIDNESTFRLLLNNDPMASDLLSDGIRRFCSDSEQLTQLIEKLL